MKNIIFLDIDGTLVDFQKTMPKSTPKALLLAKEKGNFIALCTGRAICDIYSWLLEFAFDGIVASAGAYITCQNKKIFHHILEKDKLRILEDVLKSHGAAYMFQGALGKFYNEDSKIKMINFFELMKFDASGILKNMTLCENPSQMQQIESGVYFGADGDIHMIQKAVDPYFKITGSSFSSNKTYSGEITCNGINKATGMEKLMNYMDIPRECSIAIGDGPNDVEMLQYAQIGVAMGNADESIKKLADMVTDSINEDGIYHAFEQLKLL